MRLIWLYSYQLPHRIHTAKIYPLTAPNGLLVIVYGHENGLRVVWRRPGRSEEELDEAAPAFASVHTVEVYLGGAEALHIDFPRLPPNLRHNTNYISTLLSERIFVGVACSDYSIRVVSLPIAPTESEESPEQVISLAGEPSHQSIPTCVSVTFTPRQLSEDANVQMGHGEENAHKTTTRSPSRSSQQAIAQGNANWDLLIASASPDLSGRLLIHRVPCNKSSLDGSARCCVPWKVHRLASPAVSVSFSTAIYPSSHHLRLLVAEAQGFVRIEDYLPEANRPRRIRSLYIEFGFPSDPVSSKPRQFLDCRWLLEGKAIMVLLTTGEWGIWDIEDVGPQGTEATLQMKSSTVGSQFALSGWVQAKTAKSSTSFGDSKAITSKFAPMTPGTRKLRQATLFAAEPQQSPAPPRGGLSVIPSPPVFSSRGDDSSVLMWYGTTIICIPSFLTYWHNQVRGSGNLFGKSSKGETKFISNIRFSGEACNEVSLDPCSTELESVITAGRRLIMIESLNAQERGVSGTPQPKPNIPSTDEQLLATGDLDLLGMDRVLESMSNGQSLKGLSTERNVKWIKTK